MDSPASLDVKLIDVAGGDEEESHGGPAKRSASLFSGVFNLSSTILGASALSMPHAAKDIGALLYVVMLVVIGFLSENSLFMLSECTIFSGKSSFYGVGKAAMGNTGRMLAIAVVLLQQLGACCAYIKIIGDILAPIVSGIHNSTLGSEAFWQVMLAALVCFPLCMLPRIDSLKYSSLTAVALVVVFVLMLVADGFDRVHDGLPSSQPVTVISSSVSDVFNSVPVSTFAFVCHMNVFPVLAELKNPTRKRIRTVTTGSVAVCFFVYVAAGVMGYLAFLDCTDPDVIKSYQAIHATLGVKQLAIPHTIVKVVQLGIGMALVFTYPVLAFELRHSADELMFPGRPFSWVRHTLENVALVAVSCIVAIEVKSVTTVFGYTGATMSCMVVFVLPALFYSKLAPPNSSKRQLLLARVQFVIGIILIPLCLTVLILKARGHTKNTCPVLVPILPHNGTTPNVTLPWDAQL